MFEAGQLLMERDVQKKILPVIIDGTRIYKTENRIELIKHWQSEVKALQSELDGLDPMLALEAYKDLKEISAVSQQIDGFIKMVTSMLLVKYSELLEQKYVPVFQAMGFHDITYMVDLLGIAHVESVDEKDLLLDQYAAKYSPNTYYHVVKGNNLKKQAKFDQAKFNYLEAIRLKPDNFEALNNLGFLYDKVLKDYDNARKCYEAAIRANPEMTVSRLNLGVLKNSKFNDPEGAKRQYEKILSYDPDCAKAHNNLANYYRNPKTYKKNFEQIKFHLMKAIEIDPEYTEAYMNLGNAFKLMGEMEEGNRYYRLALEHDKTGHFHQMINVMLGSVKG
jgi:tetratricopeptide (TPR) repeat protein